MFVTSTFSLFKHAYMRAFVIFVRFVIFVLALSVELTYTLRGLKIKTSFTVFRSNHEV